MVLGRLAAFVCYYASRMTGERIVLYTDGGARGNPGPAAVGAVAYDAAGKELFRLSQYIGETTNNVAEYRAVVAGLEALKKRLGLRKAKEAEVEVRLDSELVARQLNGAYQVKEEHLWPWFMRVHNLRVAVFPRLRFTHIPRAQNAQADALVNAALDAQGAAGR